MTRRCDGGWVLQGVHSIVNSVSGGQLAPVSSVRPEPFSHEPSIHEL